MAQQSQAGGPISAEPQGPPLPKWVANLLNPVMATLLRTPLHGLLSKSLLILIFDGRKTGKRYTIPVGYLAEGQHLYLFSHGKWPRNFIGGAPVAVRLRGKVQRGNAAIITDATLIHNIVQQLITERGEKFAHQMGFLTQVPGATPQIRVPSSVTFVAITLDTPAV